MNSKSLQVSKTDKNHGTLVISTFGGIGKTTFAKKYPNLAIDIEAIPYKYIFDGLSLDQALDANHELLKGTTERRDNHAFPSNYVQEIMRNIGKYRFILIVLSPETLLELEKYGIEYSIVYPSYESKDVIIERAANRGNNAQFIKKIDGLLSSTEERDGLLSSLKPKKFYTLHGHEFLEDLVLREFGLSFA